MANRVLTSSYLSRLSVANHDGVTQQIYEVLHALKTDNQQLDLAVQSLGQAREAEDAAYRRYSGKDFHSNDLRGADTVEDKYMATVRGILNAMLHLPDSEPMRRKAEMAVQLFKDFHFSVNDGFEAEARKTLNMVQQWKAATEYSLRELGIDEWVDKANDHATRVLALVKERVKTESEKVKGEMAAARKVTDQAVQKAYEVLNAIMVLAATPELTQAVNVLLSLEDRAKQYYLSGGKASGDKPAAGDTDNAGGEGGSEADGGDADGSGDGSQTGGGDTGGTGGGSQGDDNGGEEGGI